MAPLGKKTKAVRKGAPVAVVAAARALAAPMRELGTNEWKAGKAMLAPRPFRKCRRLSGGVRGMTLEMGEVWVTGFLKRGRQHDRTEESGGAAVG